MSELSEHELKILAEIEQQLANSDPSFQRRMARVQRRETKKLLRLGIVGLIVGLALLISFAVHVVVGIAGFVLMVVSLAALIHAIPDYIANRSSKVRNDVLDSTADRNRHRES